VKGGSSETRPRFWQVIKTRTVALEKPAGERESANTLRGFLGRVRRI
jgi:hypothetical protein